MVRIEPGQNHEERVEPVSDRRRRVLVFLSEIGLVAVCVGIFLAFLMTMIGVYFPEGTTLATRRNENLSAEFSKPGDVVLGVGAQDSVITQLFTGAIVGIQRRVQRRGARSLAWSNASVGDRVGRNDAVQTFSRSTALLEVNDSSRLTIGENSLIIFDQQEADPFLDNARSVLVMVDGELSGTLSSEDESAFRFGVNLPNGAVTLLPKNPGDDVEFLITINDDQSTTVNLHGGMAQVTGRDGQKRTITTQESITIDSTGTRLQVSALPSAPAEIGPKDDALHTYRYVPQEIRFDWAPVEQADRYHIVVARDPEFTDRVVDDDVLGTSFTHGALEAATYYWYVRSRTAWSQSDMSSIHRLRITQDLEAPLLQLDPPPDVVPPGQWRLSGRTESTASVFINGVRITHQGGNIDEEIELQPGANIITVMAMDDVGNLKYASVSVSAK